MENKKLVGGVQTPCLNNCFGSPGLNVTLKN